MLTIGKLSARNYLAAVGLGLVVVLAVAWYAGRWAMAGLDRNPASAEYGMLIERFADSGGSITRKLAGSRVDLVIKSRVTAAEAAALSTVEEMGVETNAPSVPEGPQALHLSAILWSAKRPMAIVNNVEVGAGDSIGGFLVVEVLQHSVRVQDHDGVPLTLDLYE